MSETWVIEVRDDLHITCEAGAIRVESGHLVAYEDRWIATATAPVASWAPGAWRAFWKKPRPDRLADLRSRIAVMERWMEEGHVETGLMSLYKYQLDRDREALSELEARAPQ